jgi:hypothetical protein
MLYESKLSIELRSWHRRYANHRTFMMRLISKKIPQGYDEHTEMRPLPSIG